MFEQAPASLQGRLAQELSLELEAAEHRAELQAAELQQRLRLSEEAGAAARSDIGRLKQEQNEDARMMEVGCTRLCSSVCRLGVIEGQRSRNAPYSVGMYCHQAWPPQAGAERGRPHDGGGLHSTVSVCRLCVIEGQSCQVPGCLLACQENYCQQDWLPQAEAEGEPPA